MLGDKGYDGDPIRQDPYDRGVIPAIPARRNRHVQRSVGRPRCAPHNRIERFIARPKISRRSAARYEPKATPEGQHRAAGRLLGFATLASVSLRTRFALAA